MRQNQPRSTARQAAISTGIFRGMRLATPPGESTRPTSSKARHAAMNSLAYRIPEAEICDLFAGSGAMGIEALSRGASSCTFFESGVAALNAIRYNLAECERRSLAQRLPPPRVRIVSRDILQLIGSLKSDRYQPASHEFHESFDILWADPPYALLPEILPELLSFADVALRAGGMLMVESGSPIVSSESNSGAPLQFKSEKKYGKTFITTWQKKDGK